MLCCWAPWLLLLVCMCVMYLPPYTWHLAAVQSCFLPIFPIIGHCSFYTCPFLMGVRNARNINYGFGIPSLGNRTVIHILLLKIIMFNNACQWFRVPSSPTCGYQPPLRLHGRRSPSTWILCISLPSCTSPFFHHGGGWYSCLPSTPRLRHTRSFWRAPSRT